MSEVIRVGEIKKCLVDAASEKYVPCIVLGRGEPFTNPYSQKYLVVLWLGGSVRSENAKWNTLMTQGAKEQQARMREKFINPVRQMWEVRLVYQLTDITSDDSIPDPMLWPDWIWEAVECG